MKRAKALPAISTTANSTCPTDPNEQNPKNQLKFQDILKKFKKKRLTNRRDQPVTQTTQHIEYIEDDNEQNIQNEKLLIKIYESNYSSLYEKMKKVGLFLTTIQLFISFYPFLNTQQLFSTRLNDAKSDFFPLHLALQSSLYHP